MGVNVHEHDSLDQASSSEWTTFLPGVVLVPNGLCWYLRYLAPVDLVSCLASNSELNDDKVFAIGFLSSLESPSSVALPYSSLWLVVHPPIETTSDHQATQSPIWRVIANNNSARSHIFCLLACFWGLLCLGPYPPPIIMYILVFLLAYITNLIFCSSSLCVASDT